MSLSLTGPDPVSCSTKPSDKQTTRLISLDDDGCSCGPKLAVFTNTDYVLRIQLTQLNPVKRAAGRANQV